MFHLLLDDTLQELTLHGTHLFPVAVYYGSASNFDQGYLGWHWHESFEINIVTAGTLHYYVENEEYFLREGDAIFINAGHLHMGHSETPDQYSKTIVFHHRLLCDDAQSEWYQQIMIPFIQTAMKSFVLTNQIPWQKQVLHELLAACDDYETKLPGYELAVKGHICTAFALIFQNTPHTASISQCEDANSHRIRKLLGYIHQNYMHPFTLADLSSLVNLSKSECSRFFSKHLRLTPFTYLTHYRIERSCELLIDSDTSISEIAILVGFNSFSYYSKCFRKIMHCSPSEYRRQIREASG